MTEVFPSLPGMAPEISMSPEFSTRVVGHVSGKETRTSFREFPQWVIEIGYEYLPHKELKDHLTLIQGLFLRMQGKFGQFLFDCPEFNRTELVLLGVGDGDTTEFTLMRDIGGFSEPVGQYNDQISSEFLIDGGAVSPTLYDVGPNSVVFDTAPGLGQEVKGSFSYYFLCRFEEDMQEYERFVYQLWQLNECTLRSIQQ